MTAEIMHHLAAAGRMADVNRIFEVEMIGHGLQIVCIVVHVVPAAGLSRATMSAPISRNDAETFAEKKKHLRVPIVRRERPAVTEHDRLSFAPVLVIDVDVSSVFFSNCDVWHLDFPFRLGCMQKCAARGAIDRHDFDPLCAPRRALNGSAKYWVSCDTFPSRNSIMLTV